jgi:hypothetical protein
MTTVRTTTTIVGAGGAMTTTTIATTTGRRTKGVHGPLARASAMQSSLRTSALRPTYQCTTGTPNLVCGSRTTGLLATPGERQMTSSSLRIYRSTYATPCGHGRAPAAGQDQRLDRPTSGLRRELPRHLHAPRQAVGVAQLQATAGESLREYIRRFSKRCTELPCAIDNDTISAFQNGTTCTSLIH